MLSDFFKLNGTVSKFDDTALVSHFEVSTDLKAVLYEPSEWPADLPRLAGCTFNNVSLSKTLFKDITFNKCVFRDCLFIGCTFSNVEFHGCEFVNCNFYKTSFDACYIDPNSIVFDRKYRTEASNIGIHLFQQLFENSSKSRQSQFEMRADIEFRRWKRWQLNYDQNQGKITKRERIQECFLSLTYEFLAGFGYKPARFVLATLIIFTGISVFNMFALAGSLKQGEQAINHITFPDAIFYTYSLLTALGFSTITPITSYAKIVAVLEALGGIGWLGIFTSLLVKRFIK